MSFVKRTRIVSVRVTVDEYEALERTSREHGANSVSEFLRQLIMSCEPFSATPRNGGSGITEELNELKRKVDRLAQIVKFRVSGDDHDELPDASGPQLELEVLEPEPVTET